MEGSKKEQDQTKCEHQIEACYQKIALDRKCTGAFQLAGYTSYQTKFDDDTSNTIFHANEFVHGGEWYDWCMVQFIEESTTDSDTISSADTISPAQILGFVKYESKGIPTPHLPQKDKPIALNGVIFVFCGILKIVVASAAGVDLGALSLNCKYGKVLRLTLEEMSHPQPQIPVHCDNLTATDIANDIVKK